MVRIVPIQESQIKDYIVFFTVYNYLMFILSAILEKKFQHGRKYYSLLKNLVNREISALW